MTTSKNIVPFEEVSLDQLTGEALPPGALARLGGEPLAHHDAWAARDLPSLGQVISISRHGLRIWDRTTGALLRAFEPLEPIQGLRWTTQVDFGEDGELFWIDAGLVRRWRHDGGEPTVCLEGMGDHHRIRLALEGELAITSGWSDGVAVWSLSERRLLYRLGDDAALSYSPDGRLLLVQYDISCQSGSDVLAFSVRDARTGALVDPGDQTTCYNQSMFWSRNGKRLLYGLHGQRSQSAWSIGKGWGGRNETIGEGAADPPPWTVRSMAVLRRGLGFGEGSVLPVRTLAFDATGRRLASSSQVWDLGAGTTRVLDPHAHLAERVAFRRDRLFRVYASGHARIFDLGTGRPLCDSARALPALEAHAYSPDACRLALVDTVEERGGILLARVPTRRDAVRWRRLGTTEEVPRRKVSLAWSSDGSTIAAGTSSSSVLRWDVATSRLVDEVSFHGDEGPTGMLCELAISADGTRVAGASWSALCLAVDGQPVLRLATERPERVRSLAFSPDGRLLAVGRDRRGMQIVRVEDQRVVCSSSGHIGATTALAFAPDGRILASGGDDGTVLLWDSTAWG